MNLNINYYSILGVKNDSTEKEIKKAYVALNTANACEIKYRISMIDHPFNIFLALSFVPLKVSFFIQFFNVFNFFSWNYFQKRRMLFDGVFYFFDNFLNSILFIIKN